MLLCTVWDTYTVIWFGVRIRLFCVVFHSLSYLSIEHTVNKGRCMHATIGQKE